jgi:hypothetical protein
VREHITPEPLPQQEQVEYRDVPGFPGYRVGSDGSVWSRLTKKGGRGCRSLLGLDWHALKPDRLRSGRFQVRLCREGRQRVVKVHRLILEVFVGPCPPGMECRHLDGNSANNALANLCWGTRRENVADAIKHGAWKGPRNGNSKLNEADVRAIRLLSRAGVSCRELAVRFAVSSQLVGNIVSGKGWGWLG